MKKLELLLATILLMGCTHVSTTAPKTTRLPSAVADDCEALFR